MIQEELLREIVGDLLHLSPEDVRAATPLNGNLTGSIGRARLDAELRKKGGNSRSEIYTVATYGQLVDAICGSGLKDSAAQKTPPLVSANADRVRLPDAVHHGVGIDIESVQNLPTAADFWESAFYKEHFTKTEIAYCMLQPNPIETFAGLWSAKEALKKACPQWAQLDWQEVEVAHAFDGSPYLLARGSDLRPEYSVSISHTAELCVAVVVRLPAEDRERKLPITPPANLAEDKASLTRPLGLMCVLLLSSVLILLLYIKIHR